MTFEQTLTSELVDAYTPGIQDVSRRVAAEFAKRFIFIEFSAFLVGVILGTIVS